MTPNTSSDVPISAKKEKWKTNKQIKLLLNKSNLAISSPDPLLPVSVSISCQESGDNASLCEAWTMRCHRSFLNSPTFSGGLSPWTEHSCRRLEPPPLQEQQPHVSPTELTWRVFAIYKNLKAEGMLSTPQNNTAQLWTCFRQKWAVEREEWGFLDGELPTILWRACFR